MKVRWLRRASASLETITDYIAQRDPGAAVKVAQSIVRTASRVARFPESGKAGRIANTRVAAVPGTPYVVVYRVRDKTVEILHVVHSAQNWLERWPEL